MADPRCLTDIALKPSFLGRLALSAIAALFAMGISGSRAEKVTIFAAASTTNALSEAAETYAALEPSGQKVRPVFAASSTLAMQISKGAPADLFLSANPAWMDYLVERQSILQQSRRDLLGNRLVLIAPADSSLQVAIGPGLPLLEALGDGRLAIGDPGHVPAGIYAKAALETLGIWHAVARRTARAANVRAALALVDRGEATAGIVYQSDAAIGKRVRVVAVFPPNSHPAIVYQLALVPGSNLAGAKRFYRFLLGPEAGAIFRKHGFLTRTPGS
jgi:molybdate transport system substrate-binding protein